MALVLALLAWLAVLIFVPGSGIASLALVLVARAVWLLRAAVRSRGGV